MAAHERRWGKMRPDTLRLWLDAITEGKSGRKNFLTYLLSLFRTGDSLEERERGDLLKYLVEHGLQAERLDEYTTVQYTLAECCESLGCGKQQAVRYRSWAVKEGLLVELFPGRKGRGALYMVSSSATASVVNGVTNTVENVTRNRVTSKEEWGHNLSEIGSHRNLVTCANADISRVIQSNPEKKPCGFICPECGGTAVNLTQDGTHYFCAECESNTAYPVR